MAHVAPLFGLLAAAAAMSTPAAAETTTAETSLLAGLGAAGGKQMGGAAISLLVTHRLRWVELGVDLQATALVSSLLGVGGVAGLHLGDDFSLRLLGSAGLHSYAGVGRALFPGDPGASGTSPYLGGRVVLGYSLPRRAGTRHRGFVGMMASVDDDLSRRTQSVTFTETSWLGGEAMEITRNHTIGQTTFAAYFVGGVELDLTGY